MKKVLLAICCFLLLTTIVSGLWVAGAINFQQPAQVVETDGPSLAPGMTMQDLAEHSDLIVTGQCIETRSTWIDRSLVTVATVAVSEVIKGASNSTVTVVLPGGADANRRFPVAMTYPGAPAIQPQEEVFLFLSPTDVITNSYMVMGYAQGKLSIVENDQGQKLVSRDLTKMRMKSGPGMVRGTIQMMLLSEFKEKIKEYLR